MGQSGGYKVNPPGTKVSKGNHYFSRLVGPTIIDMLKKSKVLALKYRPQTFGSLIGQETLVQTLSNSITHNRIAHAYLLTGVRGIGKTTTARLIAMSLNCEKRLTDSCEPCGECDSCLSVREDRNLDVIEIDAASKTGVDDIR